MAIGNPVEVFRAHRFSVVLGAAYIMPCMFVRSLSHQRLEIGRYWAVPPEPGREGQRFEQRSLLDLLQWHVHEVGGKWLHVVMSAHRWEKAKDIGRRGLVVQRVSWETLEWLPFDLDASSDSVAAERVVLGRVTYQDDPERADEFLTSWAMQFSGDIDDDEAQAIVTGPLERADHTHAWATNVSGPTIRKRRETNK